MDRRRSFLGEDSLAVGVALPDQDIVLGTPFAVMSVERWEEVGELNVDGFFCDSKKPYVAGYHYSYPLEPVEVP